MSSEACKRYRVNHIEVYGVAGKIEVRTLEHGSTLCLGMNLRNLPVNFWLDLQFEIEDVLGVKVKSIQLFPGRLGAELKEVVLIIHERPRSCHCSKNTENNRTESELAEVLDSWI